MKILLINKFYYLSGGAERYVFEWEKLLRARGHEVMVFSMRDPRNLPCEQERYFLDQVRFDPGLPLGESARAALHSIWSAEAGRRLNQLLDSEGPPDVAHLHSFIYQLTPAFLEPLRRRHVPIVQTCHEYAHVCVNQHLYNLRVNRVCEACLHHGRLAPLWTRCIKGSFAASATGCVAGLADAILGRSRARIGRFLTPSAFMRRKLIEGGMPSQRVFHEPHFIDPAQIQPSSEPGEFILFLGRLTPQKGIFTFLKAARLVPEVPCKVVGGGVLEPEVRAAVAQWDLRNVEVLGHNEGPALWDLVRRARAVVAPSEWYEPFGLVILEAMAAGRPVIASRIAGPAEIVTDGRDGLLFAPGDARELADAFGDLWRHPQKAVELGRAGRDKVETLYTPELHYRRVMRHFEEVAG